MAFEQLSALGVPYRMLLQLTRGVSSGELAHDWDALFMAVTFEESVQYVLEQLIFAVGLEETARA